MMRSLPFFARLLTVAHWAMADLRRDDAISVMSVLLLFLLIGPSLFLEVLRAGVIESWAAALQADPRNREVMIIGERPVSDAEIAELRELPLTGFIVPEPSTFISTVRLQAQGRPMAMNMRTSAAGDPLLGDTPAPTSPEQVTLTHAAALALGVSRGDEVQMTLRRRPREGPQENLIILLRVAAVLPQEVWSEEVAFLNPARAAGAALWLQPGSGRQNALAELGEDVWRSFRIYATEVRQAPLLAQELTRQGFETRIASEQVALLVNLSDGLRSLMRISVIGGIGGLSVAVWLLQVLSVARHRREIALMAAAGLDRAGLITFFVLQGLMLSLLALLLAIMCLFPMLRFSNTFADRFLQSADASAGVDPMILASAAAAVLSLSLTAAAVAAWRIRRFDLSADLRAD